MSELQMLRWLAQQKLVSFNISYSEPEDDWFAEVDSVSPHERKTWKKYSSLEALVREMVVWLASL